MVKSTGLFPCSPCSPSIVASSSKHRSMGQHPRNHGGCTGFPHHWDHGGCSGCFKNQRGGIKTQLPPAPGAQQYLNDPERNGCTCEDERLEIEWLKPFEVRVEELRGAWESGGVRHGERGTLGTEDPRGNPGIFKRLGEEMGSSAKDQENLGDLSGIGFV